MDIQKAKSIFSNHVKDLQNRIEVELQSLDQTIVCTEDIWQREDHASNKGGGGITRAYRGEVIENAGLNTSEIFGEISPDFAKKLKGEGNRLWAAGISLIFHPRNPKVPTVHANFRMIEQGGELWFGGGADLTPYYPYKDDFSYFHKTWKQACEAYETYEDWKKNCDEYFVNYHRDDEMRGIGGIFFDHFNTGDIERDLKMVMKVSESFIDSYFPIAKKRYQEEWTPEDEDFQLHRRGRYVEFNPLPVRGTLFGLKTKGRVDSILISLPARCNYTYRYKPKEGSPHQEMLKYYKPRKW